ncbi:DNA replication and repair protein RecF [Arachidicoccus ginsenosidivorans]
MSKFTRLTLIQFRNYQQAAFDFKQQIIGIAGPNGSGKTNLLDAIYYLCFTRSYFARPDSKNALHGTEGFRLEGEVAIADTAHKAYQDIVGDGDVKDDKDVKETKDAALTTLTKPIRDQLLCIVRPGGKKEFLFNQVAYDRFSQHIGRLPAVMIAPDDSQLIMGGSEERRKFIDTILAQTDPEYLQHLIHYNKILQQRNALLKSGQPLSQIQPVLSVLDQQLCHQGAPLFEKRKACLHDLLPAVLSKYQVIAGKAEGLHIKYHSALFADNLELLLKNSLGADLQMQRTTKGIHRDELVITLDGLQFKTLASQGQRKSLLFALKLASYDYIARVKQVIPILLLDDVFEKLDEDRMINLLGQVTDQAKGQIFITDTHAARLKTAFEKLEKDYQLIELKDTPDG